MVVSEGMELIVVFFALLLAFGFLVWVQKWSGIT
jgi:hypothetical protein